MNGLRHALKNKNFRHIVYILIGVILCAWAAYRFYAYYQEQNLFVHNTARVTEQHGVLVDAMRVKRQTAVLYEPITITDNRGYIAASRVERIATGQKIGDGEIISVSYKIDLDSGMHIVRTQNVSDGLQYAEYVSDGFLVPIYAVTNDTVMVARDGIAYARLVTVARTDATNALVTFGLQDGDIVILSDVSDGARVKVIRKESK